MGADLACYIVVGPAKFKSSQLKAAAKKLLALGERARAKEELICDMCRETIEAGEHEECEESCPNCGNLIVDHRKIATLEDANALIKELVGTWPPDYRDCNMRFLPGDEKRIIVVAGCETWGDTPDGEGYRLISRILNSGIAEPLEIE